ARHQAEDAQRLDDAAAVRLGVVADAPLPRVAVALHLQVQPAERADHRAAAHVLVAAGTRPEVAPDAPPAPAPVLAPVAVVALLRFAARRRGLLLRRLLGGGTGRGRVVEFQLDRHRHEG